jgi:uncharacterized cupredoxin-like copper-binding protein
MRTRHLFFLFIMAIASFSCRKDTEDIIITDITYQPPVIQVFGDVLVQVVDDAGNPVEGAGIRVGQATAQSGELGLYRFKDLTLNAAGTFVQVTASGYFPGSTRFFPRPNANNVVRIGLIPANIAGQVASASGGTVSLSNGARVSLPANGVVGASGDAYTGQVGVALHWINPAAQNLHDIMPGNLQGIDRNNREISMATFGMLAVQLSGDAGQALQVAPGKRATLTFPLPPDYRVSAPSSIPLWYFDESRGLWIEEGRAYLQGNAYVGEVSHFSFWNVDVPYPLVDITGTLHINGEPAAGRLIYIRANGLNAVGSGMTNASGGFAGKVPKDEPLTLELIGPCGTVSNINIGPFGSNTDLGVLNVTIQVNHTEVSGQLVDCNNQPVTEGAVILSWANQTTVVPVSAGGNFQAMIQLCSSSTLSIRAVDFANAYISATQTLTLTNTPMDLGELTVCDQPFTGSMELVLFNQQQLSFANTSISPVMIDYDSTGTPQLFYRLRGESVTDNQHLDILLRSPLALGTYTGEDLELSGNINLASPQGTSLAVAACYYPCNSVTVTLTQAGPNSGDLINGTISGSIFLWGAGMTITTQLSGSFSIPRP